MQIGNASSNRVASSALAYVVAIAAAFLTITAEPASAAEADGPANAYREGEWATAYEGFRMNLLAGRPSSGGVAADVARAVDCLRRLNRIAELDALLESLVDARPRDWRVLAAVSVQYRAANHNGRIVDGAFVRGRGRGRAKQANAWERDRVRCLQLAWRAVQVASEVGERQAAAKTLLDMSYAIRNYRGGGPWRFGTLTNLEALPDYETDWSYGGGSGGAPVGEDDKPVLYPEPASWETATNDGERWRWVLAEAVRWDPRLKPESLHQRIDFSLQQFGVQTLRQFRWFNDAGGALSRETGILALHTLTDDGTTAKLATGVRRFELPAEHNYLRLEQELLAHHKKQGDRNAAAGACSRLAEQYLDRRQFPRAAEYLREGIELATDKPAAANLRKRLNQIVGAWGEFEGVSTQPAGTGAEVGFRFRNAKSVRFTAQPIDTAKLLADVKAYLESKPNKLDWQRLSIGDLGYRILDAQRQKYLGEVTAQWQAELDPLEDHFDRQTTIATPLQTPGAYFVTAKIDGGNTSHIVLWVADTAIVRKPLSGSMLYYVADAESGQPIAGATLELFGFQQDRNRNKPNDYRVSTARFAAKTGADGVASVKVAPQRLKPDFRWLATATTKEGRMAFLGFSGVWSERRNDTQLDQASAYVMTDRPVYRPEQTVKFKAWVQRASYGKEATASEFAHQAFRVKWYDAKGDEVATQTLTANAYGGIESEYALPAGAPLGQYRLVVEGKGQGGFRVEEYKKPEYEVEVIAPDEAVALGDKFEARVRAAYYFGSPVTNATVNYKVTRTSRDTRWFPVTPWDWLYGPGYWWFGHDTPWYPGWERWGCRAPLPPWFNVGWEQPEVVAQGVAALDSAGEFGITIDTALAKELHSDTDHSYRIEARVVDASRRSIVGSGEVLVARQPFKVFVWLDRGHYRVGDTVTAYVSARRPDGEPVAGLGKMRLFKVTYPNGPEADPKETEVRQWEIAAGADGQAELQIKASEAGQYRVVYELAAGDDASIEGAHLFTVGGQGA
ncbi:MAG: MG2 domain-containing protein, partial [Planctomycetota bacterium]